MFPSDIEDDQEPQEVTCMHCGADGCYWQSTWDARGMERRALFKDGKRHVCAPNADDFEVVP